MSDCETIGSIYSLGNILHQSKSLKQQAGRLVPFINSFLKEKDTCRRENQFGKHIMSTNSQFSIHVQEISWPRFFNERSRHLWKVIWCCHSYLFHNCLLVWCEKQFSILFDRYIFKCSLVHFTKFSKVFFKKYVFIYPHHKSNNNKHQDV